MNHPISSGLLTSLDIAAFRERPDARFEAIDRLPAWYLDFDPGGLTAAVHALPSRFPFLETFLVEARLFWARQEPGQLRSGPWSQPDTAGLERHLDAAAVFHRESCVLLIHQLGQEFHELHHVLQRARELSLARERAVRVAGAIAARSASGGPGLDVSSDVMFRMKADGTYLEFGPDTDGGGTRHPSHLFDVAPEPVATRLLERVRETLGDGGPRQAFEYSETRGTQRKDVEVRTARCGTDEVLVVVSDVTARKSAEREVADALRRVRVHRDELLLILEQLRIGAIFVDGSGRCTLVNRSAEALCQLPASAMLGRPLGEMELFNPEDTAQIHALMQCPPHRRQRLTIRECGELDRRFWWEVDVHDDPRDPDRRILLLHDVTEVHELRHQLDAHGTFDDLVGRSEPMRQVFRLIADLAPVDTTVLIEGDTGTGKELVARSLHGRSARQRGPLDAVNWAALTESLIASQLFGHRRGAFTGAIRDQEGVIETAQRGTVFLDEIGDMPATVQSSLLRMLQEREITRLGDTRPRKVDVRILAATHRMLDDEVEAGRFRADLLYRIRVARIRIPPLRDRLSDLPLLVTRFLAEFRAQFGKPIRDVSPDAMRRLTEYGWPGNVRELRGALEFGAIRSRRAVLATTDLPQEILVRQPVLPSGDERGRVRDALRRAKGNRTEAARLLGVSRATLYRRLSELKLTPSD